MFRYHRRSGASVASGRRHNRATLLGTIAQSWFFLRTAAPRTADPPVAHESGLPEPSVNAIEIAFAPEREHSTKGEVCAAMITAEIRRVAGPQPTKPIAFFCRLGPFNGLFIVREQIDRIGG